MHYLLILLAPIAPVLALLGVHRKLVPVFYKSGLKVRGNANGIRILVANGIHWQQSTVEHEYEHIRQAWMAFLFGYWFFGWIKPYNRWRETKAYAVSVKHGLPIENAANSLQPYGYPTVADARRAIEREL
jgi:hypothetical protein